MFNADDPRSAVMVALVRRYDVIPEQISGYSFKRLGSALAASVCFVNASGQSLNSVIAVDERSPRQWFVLGSAICPSAEGNATDEPWNVIGAWTAPSQDERRLFTVVGGTVAKSVASVVATDHEGTVLESRPEGGLVVLLGDDAFRLVSARLVLRDVRNNVLWEGPLLPRAPRSA